MASDQPTHDSRRVTGRARQMKNNAAIVVALLALAACGQAAAPSSGPPTASLPVAAAPSASPTATRAPASTPEFPAPEELIARWQTELKPGDVVTLQLSESGYVITRFAIGRGHIEVEGNEIRFSQSSLCEGGEGRYHWSIVGATLHFDPVGSDPCPSRVEVLKNVTYTKLG